MLKLPAWSVRSVILLLIVVHCQVFIFFLWFTRLFSLVIIHFLITCRPFYAHKSKVFFNFLFPSFYVSFYFVCVHDTIHRFLKVDQLHSFVIIEFLWSHLVFLPWFPHQKNQIFSNHLFFSLAFTLNLKFENFIKMSSE